MANEARRILYGRCAHPGIVKEQHMSDLPQVRSVSRSLFPNGPGVLRPLLADGLNGWTPQGSWRRSNASRTAIEPSPMAVATRLTDPLRTSPTAKIPACWFPGTAASGSWPRAGPAGYCCR
jgi:hypothetical protein